jgi:hypothetical protein
MTTEKALEVLRSRFPSAILDKNHRFRPSGAKAKPRMDYAIALTGWGKVPASCGRDLRLGMIDGLPNVKHPQLAGQRLTTRAFVKKNQTAAVLGHSTSIAGLLIGKPYKTHPGGLLPGAALYVGGIFRRLPNGKVRGNLIGFLKALDWLAKKRVAVVNVSLVAADNKVMQRILRRSVKNGQVMVASVSNRGAKAKTPYPAGYREVLLVTAIDHQRKARPGGREGLQATERYVLRGPFSHQRRRDPDPRRQSARPRSYAGQAAALRCRPRQAGSRRCLWPRPRPRASALLINRSEAAGWPLPAKRVRPSTAPRRAPFAPVRDSG